jgi:hypothetical protein
MTAVLETSCVNIAMKSLFCEMLLKKITKHINRTRKVSLGRCVHLNVYHLTGRSLLLSNGQQSAVRTAETDCCRETS